jgi:ABC-type branched-subunit amino acid transport system substrate-binding protein
LDLWRQQVNRMRAGRRIGAIAAVGALALLAAACGSSSHSASNNTSATTNTGGSASTTPSSASSGATIKVGFITSESGDASSTFGNSALGAQARFDAINKQGGVDGHKIDLITADDQSTPSGNATAMQYLISKGVLVVEDVSSFAFGGAPAAQKAGIPVTGGGFDGTEWATKPYTNMFSYLGGVNAAHSESSGAVTGAALFKYLGITNVGALAYGISPSSVSSIQDLKTALTSLGIKMTYENLSVPFGGSNVGPYVLAIKSAGANGVVCSCVQSTVLALATGLKQAGVNAPSLSFSPADSSLFSDPSAAQAAQGSYFADFIAPIGTGNAATDTFVANLKATDPKYTGDYPTYGVLAAYLAADLTIKGLQVAGSSPTRTSFIQNLTQVTGWDAEGLWPYPVSFNHFGTNEKTTCAYYLEVKGNTFVPVDGGKKFCAANL